jgi:hypothetical protein
MAHDEEHEKHQEENRCDFRRANEFASEAAYRSDEG